MSFTCSQADETLRFSEAAFRPITQTWWPRGTNSVLAEVGGASAFAPRLQNRTRLFPHVTDKDRRLLPAPIKKYFHFSLHIPSVTRNYWCCHLFLFTYLMKPPTRGHFFFVSSKIISLRTVTVPKRGKRMLNPVHLPSDCVHSLL